MEKPSQCVARGAGGEGHVRCGGLYFIKLKDDSGGISIFCWGLGHLCEVRASMGFSM
jgi:hypothetical protein